MREGFPPVLRTRRTILRRMQLDDAQGWKSMNNAIARRMEWPRVPSVVYARNEILHAMRDWERRRAFTYTVLERGTRCVIGDFHVKHLTAGRAEFGHALHPKTWGTGITYEVLEAVRRSAAARGIMLWCRIEQGNIRSWRSIEKYGASFKGVRIFTVHGKRTRMRVYELW